MKAIELFDKWVDIGKDDGMQINHKSSVDYMITLIPDSILHRKFNFLDLGCGNGWLVREISKMKKCLLATGIDGSEKMIKKAVLNDPLSHYIKMDINNLVTYSNQFDIIFSMEVIYYLDSPQVILNYIFSHLLNDRGCCIIGLDHYLENTSSLGWSNDLDVKMCTYSISKWKEVFKKVGFKNITVTQFGKRKNWAGTLVLYGEK